jgi:PAS domain S-box-containing protein
MVGFASADELLATPAAAVLQRFAVLDEAGGPVPVEALPQRRALGGEAVAAAQVRFRVVATGEPVIESALPEPVHDAIRDAAAHVALSRAVSPRSYIIAPLVARGAVLGALGFVLTAASAEDRRYTADDVPLAEEVARRVALAIDNARLYQAVRRSEAQYRRLVEASPEAVAVHRDGTLLYVNAAGVRLIGARRAEDLLGRSIFDFVHPDYRAAVAARVTQVQRGGETAGVLAERFVRLDGRAVDVEVTAVPVVYEGKPASQVLIRDVTAYRQAEAALRDSRDQLDVVLRGVADGITAQAADGRLVYANDAAARMVGFATADELLATPTGAVMQRFAVLDEAGKPVPLEALPQRRALGGETVAAAQVRFRVVATGEERWSLLSSTPVFDDAERVRLAISIFRDISDQRRTEERLRFLADAGALLGTSLDVEQTLASVGRISAATLADWSAVYLARPVAPGSEGAEHRRDGTGGGAPAGSATGAAGWVVEWMAVAHSDPAKEALAAEFQRRYPPDPDEPSLLWRVLETGEPVLLPTIPDDVLARSARDAGHLDLMRSLGLTSAIWLPLTARGRTIGALGLFAGESGRRFAPDDLVLAQEIGRRAALAVDNARLYRESQDAVRARDEFLSIASHELRTPVTAVKGAAQLLQRARARGALDEIRLDRYVRTFAEGSDRLAALTDDLLDVSRLRTGHLVLRLEPVDVAALVRTLTERYGEQVAERHAFAVQTEEVCTVQADPVRLEQVIMNLVTNAVKYSPDGGAIAVSVLPAEGGVEIDVADRGIGLPPGTADVIFQPFGRAPNAAARQIPGMGLGLYICRGLIERLGGRIWAESGGEGAGTTMRVWLPCAPGADGEDGAGGG